MAAPKDFGVPTNLLHQLTVIYISGLAGQAGMLVDWQGNVGVGQIMGVLVEDTSTGKSAGVAMAGLVEVICGAAVAVGSPIGTDGAGRGIPVGAGAQIIGRAMSATTALGQKFQMYITREGTN
jgi:hypothetical protein